MIEHAEFLHGVNFQRAFSELGDGAEPSVLPGTDRAQIHHGVLRPIHRICEEGEDLVWAGWDIDRFYCGARNVFHDLLSGPESVGYLEP